MVASSLMDFAFSESSSRAVAQLVQAALSELDQIEKLDDSLAPENPTQFDRRTAALMRDEYERWARNTEALLNRIQPFEQNRGEVDGAKSLRHAYGKTRARLSISLDDMERSLKALADGDVIPMEEVRRELRLRVH